MFKLSIKIIKVDFCKFCLVKIRAPQSTYRFLVISKAQERSSGNEFNRYVKVMTAVNKFFCDENVEFFVKE